MKHSLHSSPPSSSLGNESMASNDAAFAAEACIAAACCRCAAALPSSSAAAAMAIDLRRSTVRTVGSGCSGRGECDTELVPDPDADADPDPEPGTDTEPVAEPVPDKAAESGVVGVCGAPSREPVELSRRMAALSPSP